MVRLRGGNDSLGLCECDAGVHDLVLRVRDRADEPFVDQQGERRGLAVIAESACVDWGALIPVAYRVHLDEGSHLTRVSEVVPVLALRGRGDCLRFDSNELGFALLLQPVSYEGVREARVVAASSDTADDVVGLDVELLHLLLRLLPYHRLVKEDVIQDATQGVLCVVVGDAVFDGLADRNPKASGVVGVFLEEAPPYVSLVARR